MIRRWCVRLLRFEGTDAGRVLFTGTREECEAWTKEHPLQEADTAHRCLDIDEETEA